MHLGRRLHSRRRSILVALLAVAVLASLVGPGVATVAAAPPPVITNFPMYEEAAPNDPLFNLQWGLNTIDAPQAWGVTPGSPNVTVAVVDTGVWYTDTDIAANMWNNTDGSHGWNFILNNNNPMDSDSASGTYHGTGVGGVIAAVTNNNYLIAGVAQVRVMALEALGPNGEGSSYNTSLAIKWAADHGARVINLSLGTNQTYVGPTDIQLAINYAWGKGALVIAAAGNSGTNSLDYPASLPNVVSVGAVDQTDTRASFSNYGTGLSISAPGVQILTLSASNEVHYLSGTSLATPYVSGVAALILSLEPTLTNVELWNILNTTAVPAQGTSCSTPPCYNTQYGWGIVNAWNAINALNKPFISVNSFPRTVSQGASFSIGWSVLGPAGLSVSDTHVVYGTTPGALGNSTAALSGTTRQNYTAANLQMPGTGPLYFQIVATVNGTTYTSPVNAVGVSSLPPFIDVLIQLLSSNLLYLALFILALAAVVAFVPQRRARARREAAYRARTAQPAYRYPAPPPGPPPGPPNAYAGQSMQSQSAAPPIEFVRPAAPPPAPVQPAAPPPPPAVLPKKRCPNCGTLVNADNMFCFYCGNPFR